MSKHRKTDYDKSVEADGVADRAGSAFPLVNIEAVREPVPAPVQVTDFAINRPGVGVKKRCAPFPYGCGQVVDGDHVCGSGRGRNAVDGDSTRDARKIR